MLKLLARIRAAWRRFWTNPETQRRHISQIDWQRPGGD